MIFYLDKMQPKGSIGVECGEALLKHGYKLKFFNTINFSKSMRYNPMAYIHSEKDVLKLVTALMTNTKGEGQGGDPFWDKAERLLLVSLIAYLHYEAPVEEQNFATLLEMLNTIQMLVNIIMIVVGIVFSCIFVGLLILVIRALLKYIRTEK